MNATQPAMTHQRCLIANVASDLNGASPSLNILQQIAKGLRISAEQLYVRAGILESRAGDPALVAAILADTGLQERQKQVLIDIYETFRRENATAQAAGSFAESRSQAQRFRPNTN